MIKERTVYCRLAGQTYAAKTDAQGKVTFKLPKLKKGTYTMKVFYKQNVAYGASSNSATIKIQ